MTKIASSLYIRNLELQVYLGWPHRERLKKQIVMVDITINYLKPPEACKTDHLNNTLCYSEVITAILAKVSNQKFHLVEYVTQEIYSVVKSYLPVHATAIVQLTKRPTVRGFQGDVQFTYGDQL